MYANYQACMGTRLVDHNLKCNGCVHVLGQAEQMNFMWFDISFASRECAMQGLSTPAMSSEHTQRQAD